MRDILIMLWKILTELLKEILLDNHYKTKPGCCGRVVSASACHAQGVVQIWHPTSAETRMWGKQLAAMLAIYTGRGVHTRGESQGMYITFTSAKYE